MNQRTHETQINNNTGQCSGKRKVWPHKEGAEERRSLMWFPHSAQHGVIHNVSVGHHHLIFLIQTEILQEHFDGSQNR